MPTGGDWSICDFGHRSHAVHKGVDSGNLVGRGTLFQLQQSMPSSRTPKPLPNSHAGLLLQEIRIINKAISDREGSLQLYDFADEDGSSQVSRSIKAVRLFDANVVSYEVPCTTIDDLIERRWASPSI